MVTKIWKRIDRRIVLLVVLLLAVGVGVNAFSAPAEMKTVTAHFDRAVSVYEDTEVRILGVKVGRVTAVTPEGNSVRVDMEYDAEYRVPEDAEAVIVTPTLVADRFVQLTPVYTSGDVMADGADIPLKETGVPVELDRIYGSLSTLTKTLGPNGVNEDGTLNDFLKAARKGLEGQGARGNQMIRDLAAAAETFGEGAGPLFDTVTDLATFTTTLAQNDRLVRAFMKDLADVSDLLADESDELQAAVAAVADAVGSVKGFVKDNRDGLVTNVRQLTTVMSTIASEKDNLDTALRIAPVAMGNLQLGFDHATGTQSSRIGIGGNIWDADGFLCGVVQQNPLMPRPLKNIACELFEQLLEPITSSLPFLPPEYSSYLPSKADTPKGIKLPESEQVGYSAPTDPSVSGLLGGAS